MAMYTLDARFARFENEGGEMVYKNYPPGTPVDLSNEEVGIFAAGVAHAMNDTASKPIFRTTVAQSKDSKVATEADSSFIPTISTISTTAKG